MAIAMALAEGKSTTKGYFRLAMALAEGKSTTKGYFRLPSLAFSSSLICHPQTSLI